MANNSSADLRSARLVRKANGLFLKIENSVSTSAAPGFAQNVYGTYFKIEDFDEVIALMCQAEIEEGNGGYASAVKAAYLAWARKNLEAEATYKAVISSGESHSKQALLGLAKLYVDTNRRREAEEVVKQYNDLATFPISLESLAGVIEQAKPQ